MSFNKRVQLPAVFVDSLESWELGHIDIEPTGVIYLWDQAAIRESGPIAKAKLRIGIAFGNKRFQRLEASADPMLHPLILSIFGQPQRPDEMFKHAQVIERMNITSNCKRTLADKGTISCIIAGD